MEKCKEKYQKLKENYTAKVTENKSLKEELLNYQVEVRTLRRGFSENGVYCGRNTTSRWRKKGEWDQIDLCNNDIVKSFCKTKLLLNHKFLGPEQLKYMDDKRSLCYEIYAEVQIPYTIKTHVDKIFYWDQRLVPMINTKLVEVRSNFNSYIKKQYLGMYAWLKFASCQSSSNNHAINCLSANKDSTRPDAYNLDLHEALCVYVRPQIEMNPIQLWGLPDLEYRHIPTHTDLGIPIPIWGPHFECRSNLGTKP